MPPDTTTVPLWHLVKGEESIVPSQGGVENIDFETKSVKSVTWEVAEKIERVWHFQKLTSRRHIPPVLIYWNDLV